MKNRFCALLLTLTIIPATSLAQAPAAPVEPAPAPPVAKIEIKKVASPLEGAWVLIESWDGEDKEDDLGLWFEFKGDKVTSNIEGDKETADLKVDPNKKHLVITAEGETVHVLYKIEKDILTMAYLSENEEFPKNFNLEDGKEVFRFKFMKPIDKQFHGMWTSIETWEDGEKVDAEQAQDVSFKISAYEFAILDTDELAEANGEEVEPDEVFLATMDEKMNRMQLDDQMGEKFNCIYKVEKGIFIIHFYANSDEEGKIADYPKDFKITDDSILLKLKKSSVKMK